MKYRPNKSSLDQSLALVREFEGRTGLIALLREELDGWQVAISDDLVHVTPYVMYDAFTGWKNVHIVTIDGYGVMGFCEGPAA